MIAALRIIGGKVYTAQNQRDRRANQKTDTAKSLFLACLIKKKKTGPLLLILLKHLDKTELFWQKASVNGGFFFLKQ